MTMPMPPISEKRDRSTWWSFLAGIVIWFVHLNVVYPVTSVACKWGWFPFAVGPISGLQAIQTLLTAIAVVLLSVTIYVPWRTWRRSQTEEAHLLRQTERDRRPLMAFVTMMLNSTFLIYAIATFVPVLALNPCG